MYEERGADCGAETETAVESEEATGSISLA